MNPVELIRKKREGLELTREELRQLIDGYVAGTIPDYQMSAWLMAVVFRGMTEAETSAFTDLMLHSGAVFDLSDIPGVKVDKHSTGGVGDKVSLILAPMVAACGVPVPMISGRGLGHTGGTLDKLESIPGFRTAIPMDEYRVIIAECGLVLAGQTAEVVPADRKLYALRDVTATVEAIPLIAGSIMSKKLAEGIDALVLDIKTGNGAFMREERDSVALARALVDIGNRAGKRTIGFVTGMDQPLGMAVGNWLEVVESIDCLKGKPIADLMEVTYVLGGAMVYLGGKAPDIASGMKLCREAIYSGRALEKFLALVRRQGGDLSFLSGSSTYPRSGRTIEVRSERSGFLAGFDTRRIGMLAIELGAGRKTLADVVDPKAGILLQKKAGEEIHAGDLLAVMFTDREGSEIPGPAEFRSCLTFTEAPEDRPPLIRALVDHDGVHPWQTPVVH
jgi:pyrimidine-nucleoside phosphorylase